MGFWLNNFIDFERKRKRANRLILGFSFFPDSKEKVSNARAKIYVPHKVKIPTWFLTHERADEIENRIKSADPQGISLERKRRGRFDVLIAETPDFSENVSFLETLGFQTGNYVKMLRYSGFYPDRKASIDDVVLNDNPQNGEAELANLDFISFEDFPTLEEAKKMPYVILDIEKPLWKHEREKELIELREKLLKFPEDEKTKRRKDLVSKIEQRLTWKDELVENGNLYDKKFNADVSFVGTIWVNGEEKVKELYMIDSKMDSIETEANGFKILKFSNEKELVSALKDSFEKRNPFVAIGHNQVYDYTQLRFASEENKMLFDPVVKDVQPRRDFVLDFLQRQREDLIYIDTLWFGRIKHPYLNQKRFGTSFKLAQLAQHLGIDFEKSLNHEQLREVEMRRLTGINGEVRKNSATQMIDYTVGDLDNTEKVFLKLDPWPVLVAMKKAMPFCTYTELAFSPNIVNHLHEHRHFIDVGNLPYTGFKRGPREREIEFFKKEFPKLKHEHLKLAGLKKAKKGEYENVSEYYVSVESWFLDTAFLINPELEEAYNSLKDENEFVFLQYMKSYMVQVFSDYFKTNVSAVTKIKKSGELKCKYVLKKQFEQEIQQKRFYAAYGFDPLVIRRNIREGYSHLAEDINNQGIEYLDHIGDYIFVQGSGEIRGARKIRCLESFVVE